MKKRSHYVIALGIILGVLMLSGCWDSKEVESLAVSTLMGFDRITESGQDLWQISSRILDLRVQTKSEGGGASSAQEILIVGKGETLQDGFHELFKHLPAKAFFDHNTAIILGEKTAQKDLSRTVIANLRFPRIRIRVFLFVSRGEAYEILQAQPELGTILSKEIQKIADRTVEQNGTSLKFTVLDFTKQMLRKDRDAVLPEIKVYSRKKGEETAETSVIVDGFGVIRESKLVGWLEGEEALGYILSVSKPRNLEVPIHVNYGDIEFSYFLSQSKGRIKAQLIEGKPKYTISIKAQGLVHETSDPALGAGNTPELEKAAEERIMNIAWQAVNKAREYDADIFGFNEYLHRHHPRDWQNIASDWRKSFREAEIEIEVDAKIHGFGTSNAGFDL